MRNFTMPVRKEDEMEERSTAGLIKMFERGPHLYTCEFPVTGWPHLGPDRGAMDRLCTHPTKKSLFMDSWPIQPLRRNEPDVLSPYNLYIL